MMNNFKVTLLVHGVIIILLCMARPGYAMQSNNGLGSGTSKAIGSVLGANTSVGIAQQDPIDTATGAQVLTNALLAFKGAGSLYFKMSYYSLLNNKGPLGHGWHHDYETHLVQQSDGSIDIYWNANAVNSFYINGDGSYSSPDKPSAVDKLLKNTDETFTLVHAEDNSIYQFNASGQLTRMQNGEGQTFDLTYLENNLYQVTAPRLGDSLTFTYSNNLISTVTDSLGYRASFTYDADGNLAVATDGDGSATTYAYTEQANDANEPQWYIQSSTDNKGATFFVDTYDNLGRVISQWDGIKGHNPATFSYDESSDPGELVTTDVHRDGTKTIFVYDSRYNLVSKTDQIGDTFVTTTYAYDAFGHCIGTQVSSNQSTAVARPANSSAASIQVNINGSPLPMDVQPTIVNGCTLVPLRAIFEALGVTVQWYPDDQSIIAAKGDVKIKLRIGSTTAFNNGVQVTLEAAPQIINGRTMVPARFVSESLGAQVNWDAANRQVNIVTSP